MIETPDIILPPNWSLASCIRCLYSDRLLSRLHQLKGGGRYYRCPPPFHPKSENTLHILFFSIENTPFLSLPSPSKCINPPFFEPKIPVFTIKYAPKTPLSDSSSYLLSWLQYVIRPLVLTPFFTAFLVFIHKIHERNSFIIIIFGLKNSARTESSSCDPARAWIYVG